MTDEPAETRSVVVEREFPFPSERIWRALTQPWLIREWLLQNDFAPMVGHAFTLRAQAHGDWDGIIDCKVLAIEEGRALAYTWESGDGPLRVSSVVRWTLTPINAGTLLRMEQSGFRADQPQNYQGARHGWQAYFAKLAHVLEQAG